MSLNDRNWIESFTSITKKLQYKEEPVSMEEFLTSDKFFGKTISTGGEAVYPRWMEELKFISEENSKYLDVFSGAIGTGKSRAAIWGMGWVMHHLLCLKDPWKYFEKAGGGRMAIVFFNINKSLGESKGFNILQSHLMNSEWFLKRGRVSGKVIPTLHFDLFDYVLASPYSQASLGQDVILALMDEVDAPNASEKLRKRVISSVEQALRRFRNRFVFSGETIGRFFVVSSKQDTLSFINAFIAENASDKSVHIVDIPVWEALPESRFCGKKFKVMLGDVFTESKVIDTKEEEIEAINKGFRIIDVPIEFENDFRRDTVGSLRDYAGVSVSYLRKRKLFVSEKILYDCYDAEKLNPVSKDTIEIGIKHDFNIVNFLDFNKIRINKNVPRFIHGDVAYSGSGDAYGLAMSCVSGWTKVNKRDSSGEIKTIKLPVVETDFVMRLKAPVGDEIPLDKVALFIADLKKLYGFNIVLCTFDLELLSVQTKQLLESIGMKCDKLSLDKKPELYRGFKNLVQEGRWVFCNHPYLHFELANLEDDHDLNKVDHPEKVVQVIALPNGDTKEVVMKGSKDIADACVGSVSKALEVCKTPPDIEIMRNLYKVVEDKDEKYKNLDWVLGNSASTDKKEPDKPNKKQINDFKELFKRSQGL